MMRWTTQCSINMLLLFSLLFPFVNLTTAASLKTDPAINSQHLFTSTQLWLLLTILLLFCILLWNRALRRRVAVRTAELQQYQQQLELMVEERTVELNKLSSAVEQSHSIIVITDSKGIIEFVNPAFSQVTGYTQQEALGQNLRILRSGQQDDTVYQAMWETLTQDKVWQGEIHNKRKDGSLYWEFATTSPVKDKNGKTTHYVIVKEDISERKAAQDQLRLAASVFAYSQQSIIITDIHNRIIDVNPARLELTGFTREEVLGESPQLFSSGLQKEEFYTELWQTLKKNGFWEGEIWNSKKSGEMFAERLAINIVRDEAGKPQHYVAVSSDITSLKKHEVELQQLAYNDALTGLPNRRLLNDRMQQALMQAKRYNTLMAVCYLDLDGFKEVNDTYGHKAGDQVLLETGDRLRHSIRDGDTVSRLGGDEFVLLILSFSNRAELEQVLDRVLHEVSQPYVLSTGETVVSASIGIALYPDDDNEAETLLRHADQAMYVAKRHGKNRYCFFDPHKEQKMTAEQIMQQVFDFALNEGQLRLFYQPKVNMGDGEVVGVEALIRWQHPQLGLLSPDAFLPAIESRSTIITMGNWVLRQAFSQMRAWQAEGIELRVSVNIASRQFEQPDFIILLKALLEEFSDIPASRLELEIMETTAMYDIGHFSRIMAECSALGIHFSLDDFGTGYSSLTYLKKLPARTVKIDQSFVQGLLNNEEDIAIIRGILGLCAAFDRTPLAEGVETVEQGVRLLEMGCELGQGYCIAKPMPAEELPDWLGAFQVAPEWLQTKREGL